MAARYADHVIGIHFLIREIAQFRVYIYIYIYIHVKIKEPLDSINFITDFSYFLHRVYASMQLYIYVCNVE